MSPTRGAGHRRLLLFLAVVLAGGAWYAFAGDRLKFEQLARFEAKLRELQTEDPLLVYSVAFVTYVAVVALSLPGATVLTPLVGWLFGLWRGILFASFAATTGSTLAFLMSRYLLREYVERRFGDRLVTVNAALDRDGPYYLLSLRMAPVVPFFVINLVMGLTRLRATTFWWVSQLGMLPATCLFVYFGTTVPTLAELSQSSRSILNWQLIVALMALGLLPLGLRYLLKLIRHEPLDVGTGSA